MFSKNTQVKKGLVNSTLSTVRSINQSGVNVNIDKVLPIILVEFNSYNSLALKVFRDFKVVPIKPSYRKFKVNNKAYTRTQVPLTIAQAITIYKS